MNNSTISPTQLEVLPRCSLNGIDHFIIFCFGGIIFIGVVGNVTICFVYGLFNRKHKSNFEILILYLAISDLLVCSLAPFLAIYWRVTCDRKWDFGLMGCKLMGAFRSMFFNTSSGILILFSIIRYRAVYYPFKGQLRNIYIHGSVVVVLVISASTEILYADALTVVVYDAAGSVACFQTSSNSKKIYFRVTLGIIAFRDFVFLFIFTCSSTIVTKKLRLSAATIENMKNKKTARTSKDSRAKGNSRSKKIVRSVLILQIIFMLLVIPNDVFHFVYILSWIQQDGGIATDKNLFMYFKIFAALQILNSIVNVFVYAKLQKLMKKNIYRFFGNLGCSIENEREEFNLPMATFKRRGKRIESTEEETSMEKFN